jgi:hypothetical protein
LVLVGVGSACHEKVARIDSQSLVNANRYAHPVTWTLAHGYGFPDVTFLGPNAQLL